MRRRACPDSGFENLLAASPCSKWFDCGWLEESGFLRIPSLESLLHLWIGEQREADVVLDRPVDDTFHVRTLFDLRRWNLNLMAEPRRVRDRRAIHHTVQTSPQRAGHTHRAWFAGSVEGITPQRMRAELVAGQPDRAQLGVTAGVVLLAYRIGGAHQAFTGLAM